MTPLEKEAEELYPVYWDCNPKEIRKIRAAYIKGRQDEASRRPWIDSKDALPDFNKTVLLWRKTELGNQFFDLGFYDGNIWLNFNPHTKSLSDVIAWRELDEPAPVI